jgi:hypothetical protein
MQQTKIWNDPRYKDFARDAYAWTHNFLVIDDFQSVSVTVLSITHKSVNAWAAREHCEVLEPIGHRFPSEASGTF